MRRQKTGNRGAVLILVAALGILPVAAPGISPVTVLAATKKDVDDAKGKISSLEEEKMCVSWIPRWTVWGRR